MNADAKAHAAHLLKRCRTLTDAERSLIKISPIPSRPMIWGLLDGYLDRPTGATTFSKEPAQIARDEREYAEGVCIGQELRAAR